MDKVTAIRWSWRDDSRWVEYNPQLNLYIENEYRKGTKRIKVDEERFIDVSLTVCIITISLLKALEIKYLIAEKENENYTLLY